MRYGTRLVLGAFAILFLATTALLVAADRWFRAEIEREFVNELEREARLIALGLADGGRDVNTLAHDYGAALGRRVSVIDQSGRVIGDSDFDDASLALLDNHANRPEVAEALEGRVGIAKRLSESTDRVEVKVAVPAAGAVVRVSAPMTQVEALVGHALRAILLAGLAMLVVGGVLAWAGGKMLARPVRELAEAARVAAAGGTPSYPTSRAPEVQDLVLAFREMHEDAASQLAQLRSERERVETLLASMAEGVVLADPRGEIVLCNDATRQLLGFPAPAPLPPLRELFHQREAREVVDDVLAGRTSEPREVAVAGHELLLSGRPLPHGGAVLGLLDVTDLKRLQVVRRDFVANVSHELKTPLTSIVGYSETLLTDHPDEATRRQFLATLHANAVRMQHLVDDLLDLARLESGAWKPVRVPIDLAAVTAEVWGAYSERAHSVGIALAVEGGVPGTLTADLGALRQILRNLIDNAMRYTPAGGRITVACAARGNRVEVTVSDTGAGIPADHLPRVFERFYRADPGRSRAEGGTGLGLSIVRHLVEAHGGRVEAESAVDRGTVIRMFFPAVGGT